MTCQLMSTNGITVNSYLKPGHVTISCAVEEMNLPPQCQTIEPEAEKMLNMCMYGWAFVSKWVRDTYALI